MTARKLSNVDKHILNDRLEELMRQHQRGNATREAREQGTIIGFSICTMHRDAFCALLEAFIIMDRDFDRGVNLIKNIIQEA